MKAFRLITFLRSHWDSLLEREMNNSSGNVILCPVSRSKTCPLDECQLLPGWLVLWNREVKVEPYQVSGEWLTYLFWRPYTSRGKYDARHWTRPRGRAKKDLDLCLFRGMDQSKGSAAIDTYPINKKYNRSRPKLSERLRYKNFSLNKTKRANHPFSNGMVLLHHSTKL